MGFVGFRLKECGRFLSGEAVIQESLGGCRTYREAVREAQALAHARQHKAASFWKKLVR